MFGIAADRWSRRAETRRTRRGAHTDLDEIRVNPIDPASMQARMAEMAARAAGVSPSSAPTPSAAAASASGSVDFASVLRDAVREVNAAQNTAQAKAQAFSMGAPGVSIEEVMVSMQKANLAFQGMIAVRNRLVDAYRDVSNLQV